MEDMTERELRYLERENRAIENERRQTLLELQRQRETITKLRTEARAQKGQPHAQERESVERSVRSSVRDEITRTEIEADKLDYAGRLPISTGSFLTIDDIDSQLSDDPFETMDMKAKNTQKEKNKGKQRDVSFNEEELQQFIDSMSFHADIEKKEAGNRHKSLQAFQTEENNCTLRQSDQTDDQSGKLPQQSKYSFSKAMQGARFDERNSFGQEQKNYNSNIDNREPAKSPEDDEELILMRKIQDLTVQETLMKEERLRRQTAEKAMEKRLQALQIKEIELRKEREREERLKVLKLKAQRIEALISKGQAEERRM